MPAEIQGPALNCPGLFAFGLPPKPYANSSQAEAESAESRSQYPSRTVGQITPAAAAHKPLGPETDAVVRDAVTTQETG